MKRLIILQNIAHEGPSLFESVAAEFDLTIELICPFKNETIPKLNKDDLLLILGGPMGVSDIDNQNYLWLKDEINLIKYALKELIPFIGVCLGAQLLAHVVGGSVRPLIDKTSGKPKAEIGWMPIQFKSQYIGDLVPSYNQYKFYVLHWHLDRIILPSNIPLLASSLMCNEQLFRIGRNAFGIQFHLEIDKNDIEEWVFNDSKFINDQLGVHGAHMILEQDKKYNLISRDYRIAMIRSLFNLIKHSN